ncbi:MAG: CdaR family transcriptional regulator [Oscillospiraceae bacterium]|jgi:carbohydrate diacid regulator
MNISKAVAQAIIEEIGAEIQEHMIMTDSDGYIIASTNLSRLGTIHEGARRIITEELDELYISKEMETETTKMGISLPLIVHGEIVGVVGITGEKQKVAGYGNIVRHMTEIMIADRLRKDVKRYDRRVRYRFMEEWISRSSIPYSEEFIERGHNLGIDITRPHRALVIFFTGYQKLSDTLKGQRLLEEMEDSIRHEMRDRGALYLREPPKQICLLPACSNDEMQNLAKDLIQLIEDTYKKQIVIGFDSSTGNKLYARQCCAEAEKAASHALIWNGTIVCYDDLNIELFLDEISTSTMEEYLEKLFMNIPKKKLKEYIALIEAYFAYNGSINKMADALYMHKNTLQYKLKKLAELTGQDIRVPLNISVYYMALIFYRKIYHKRAEF